MTSRARALKIVMDFSFLILSVLFIIFVVPKIILFFLPVLIGYIISCFANPIVRFLEEKVKIVRKHGSALVIFLVVIAMVFVLCGIVYVFVSQAINLIEELPKLYERLELSLDKIGKKYSNIYNGMPSGIQDYLDSLRNRISNSGTNNSMYKGSSFGIAKATIKGFTTGIISIIFAIMSAYFFTVQREKIICRMRLVMSGKMMGEVRNVVAKFKSIIGDYFKVQIKIMLILIVVLYIGFIIFDIKYALVIAVLTSLLDFLPLFGIGAVLLPWAILALLLGEYVLTVGLIVLYVICLAIREVAEPKMMGKSIGLNTYETFFLLFIGFKIGGLVGLLFSIPLGVLGINLYKAGVLDSIVGDCKYIAISVDKFSREGKNSINKEIDRRMNN